MRAPHFIGDPKRDPTLENYPYGKTGPQHSCISQCTLPYYSIKLRKLQVARLNGSEELDPKTLEALTS